MDIWIVGEFMQDGWAFIGAYGTEAEAESAISGNAYGFMFPWKIGVPMTEEYPDQMPGFLLSPECFNRRRRQEEERRLRDIEIRQERRMAALPVEHEVIRNDDGSTTVRVKE